MIRVPAFHPRFLVQALPSGETVLVSETGTHVLSDSACGRITPLIDGVRTTSEIAALLSGCLAPGEVWAALERLESSGYVCEAEPGLPRRQAAFWQMIGAEPTHVRERLRGFTVSVDGPEPDLRDAVKQALAALGIRVERTGALRVVVAADYTCAELAAWNREALQDRRPWVLLKPLGVRAHIGPLLIPGQTACWACLVHRIKENHWMETGLWGAAYDSNWPAASIAALPTTCGAAVTLAATEIAKWAAGESARLAGTLWTLEFHSLRLEQHSVTRRPQCPCCGIGTEPRLFRLPLDRADETLRSSLSGLRVEDPAITLSRLERQLSSVTGIVHDLIRISGEGEPPVYAARHVRALPLRDTPFRIQRGPGEAAGKGWTDAEARASCLAEAIERYSAVFQGDEARFLARYRDVAGSAVHPSLLTAFSEGQYGRTGAEWVPDRFREDEPIEWVPAFEVLDGRVRYLPAAYVYLDYLLPGGHRFCLSDTNGCAAGNAATEAVLQGICELIERDAISIWWHNRLRRPAVDTRSFNEPRFELALRHLADRGRAAFVLDVTTDAGIPVFVAVSHDAGGSGVAFGAGAHPDAQVACARAISELLQTSRRSTDEDRAAAPEFLFPCPSDPVRADAFARFEPTSLSAAVCHVAERLRACGVEVLVTDLSRPDTGLSVVRVTAPGLRPLGRRLGPGRLYDVPVKLGWLSRPAAECDMNPAAFRFSGPR